MGVPAGVAMSKRRLYLRATLKVMAAVMFLALLVAFCSPV